MYGLYETKSSNKRKMVYVKSVVTGNFSNNEFGSNQPRDQLLQRQALHKAYSASIILLHAIKIVNCQILPKLFVIIVTKFSA